MSEGQRKSAVKRKRSKAQGVGGKPTNVSTFTKKYYGGMIDITQENKMDRKTMADRKNMSKARMKMIMQEARRMAGEDRLTQKIQKLLKEN